MRVVAVLRIKSSLTVIEPNCATNDWTHDDPQLHTKNSGTTAA